MKKDITSAGIVAAGIEAAWEDVAVSFDRFCLTAGVATLAEMMQRDAAELCGPRHGRNRDRRGYRWGRTKRWRNTSMGLRWTAAAMQEAAKGLRRLKACKQLPLLRAALAAHQSKHADETALEPEALAA